jgi:tetratricopeptide (TPR) repeat protein
MAKAGDVKLVAHQGKLIAQVGRKRKELSYEQAFSLGHSLLETGHYERALDVFRVLAQVRGRGPRAKLMLARCKAEIDGFEASKQILHTVFDGENEPIAEELQGAFVFHTMGLQEEAIREMGKVVKKHPDLPTACLFLGDLFREAGKLDKAVKCWKLAIKRDRRGGGVAIAARKELTDLAKRMKKAKQRQAIKVVKKGSRTAKRKKRG